jgi:hypothetical protein
MERRAVATEFDPPAEFRSGTCEFLPSLLQCRRVEVAVEYIDAKALSAMDPSVFQHAEPFPWINPAGFLTDAGFARLVANLPDVSQFTSAIDAMRVRKYGQKNHDRFVLEYVDGIDIPLPWQELIDELRGDRYRAFIASLLGHRHFRFRFHWHYTPGSCSVSPHCDSRTKLGSHIFYLNTRPSWDPAWGGETVILDDHGRFDVDSSPAFEDFDSAVPAQTMDNRSLIFSRRGNSWHGVRAIECPEGALRKVFIVVFEDYRRVRMLTKRMTRLIKGKPLVAEKELGMY